MRNHLRKTLFALLSTTGVCITLGLSTVNAADTGGGAGAGGNIEALLQQIVANTKSAVDQLAGIYTVLKSIATDSLIWTAPDDSETTANLQVNFTQYGLMATQALTTQTTLQEQLDRNLLNINPSSTKMQGVTSTRLQNANQLAYSTILLGKPIDPSQKTPSKSGSKPATGGGSATANLDADALAYIQNASGINNKHTMPDYSWAGNADDVDAYFNYFNTIMAVESFNSHILARQYAERTIPEQSDPNTLKQALITQAASPDWFKVVSSENVGWAIRQILLYQSQAYILMTQLLQAQKETAAAQAMTNSLLILLNHNNETNMISKAQGVQQSP